MRIDAYAEARDPHTKRTIFTAIDARSGGSGGGMYAGLGDAGGMAALPAGRVGQLDGQEVRNSRPMSILFSQFHSSLPFALKFLNR